jgi:single-strand DNA-binding protein
MPKSINKVILVGNLGRDAETKFIPSGAAVTNFSVATARRWKDQSGEWKEETEWHNVQIWKAEKLAEYLRKGTTVYVEGRLKNRSYEDKDGQKRYVTEIIADDVILLGGGKSDGDGVVSRPRSSQGQARPSDTSSQSLGITDDDVPF